MEAIDLHPAVMMFGNFIAPLLHTIIEYFLIAQLFHFSPLFALIFTQIYPSFLKQVSVDPSKFKMVCVMLDLGYKYKKRVKKEMNKFEILALSSSEPRYSE